MSPCENSHVKDLVLGAIVGFVIGFAAAMQEQANTHPTKLPTCEPAHFVRGGVSCQTPEKEIK